jgi:hypothetical protein
MTDEDARTRAFAIFDPIAAEYLARDGVDIGPMFGSEGLRIRGKVFAFAGFQGSVILKLPEARTRELEGQPGVERMVMRERAMREWMILGPDAADLWAPLIGEAFAYVDEITP